MQIDDPFTRRSTKPRMTFRAGEKEAEKLADEQAAAQWKREQQDAPIKKHTTTKAQPTQVTQEDLFSAHDFDIKIDLEVPLPGKLLHIDQFMLKWLKIMINPHYKKDHFLRNIFILFCFFKLSLEPFQDVLMNYLQMCLC